MSKWFLEYFGLMVVRFFFHLFSIDFSSRSMGFFWRRLAPFNRRHLRVVSHLKMCFPDKNEREIEKIASNMWENLGRTFIETLMLRKLMRDESRFSWDFSSDDIELAKSGAIFVSFHYGNWEVVSYPLYVSGIPPRAIYKIVKNPFVDSFLFETRSEMYGGHLYSFNPHVPFNVFKVFKKHGVSAVLSDLVDKNSVPIKFFGLDSMGQTLPAVLSRVYSVPIYVARCRRLNGVRFHISGEWVNCPSTDDKNDDIQRTTQKIHDLFENWIREDPSQWMWNIKKW